MPFVRSWIVAVTLLGAVVGGCGTAAAVTAAQSAAGPIQLTAEAVAVMLTPSAAAQRLDTAKQIWLVLLDVQAAAQPGVQYGLYLNLPAGGRPSGHRRITSARSISFPPSARRASTASMRRAS